MGNPFALLLSLCIFIRVESIDLFGSYVNQDGAEYVYQLPATRGGGVVGVVFLAHGCSHSSTDWWPQGGQCESCLGLPVEQAIVRFALSLNYAAIAISSSNRRHKCWISPDRGKVSMILNNFYVDFLQGDLSTPLYMVGASSGGAFVAALAQSPDLKAKVGAVCVQISSVRKPTAVPTLFVLMKRDEATLQDVREKAAGGYFADHRILLCGPRAITPAYLSAMGAVRSKADSSAIHKALLHHGLLDQATFLLLEDPRHSSWRQVPYRPAIWPASPSCATPLTGAPHSRSPSRP